MIKKVSDKVVFNLIGYIMIIFFSLCCLVPFIIIVSSSLTNEAIIHKEGFQIIPKGFTFYAYTTIFAYPIEVLKAYGMSIYVTLVGSTLGLFLTSMAAYVLSRKDFKWRNKFAFFFYFTTLFNGGLVPWYILCVQYLKFKELPFIALVAPSLLSVFNIIIMKSFMSSIPDAIYESAKIDGAKQFTIFMKLILPLSKPAMATVGLFMALSYWNDWFLTFMFVNKPDFYTLQFYLYKTISAAQSLKTIASVTGMDMTQLPIESAKMAMTVIATGPIFLLYPFLQKYFVKGLTIGAVKG